MNQGKKDKLDEITIACKVWEFLTTKRKDVKQLEQGKKEEGSGVTPYMKRNVLIYLTDGYLSMFKSKESSRVIISKDVDNRILTVIKLFYDHIDDIALSLTDSLLYRQSLNRLQNKSEGLSSSSNKKKGKSRKELRDINKDPVTHLVMVAKALSQKKHQLDLYLLIWRNILPYIACDFQYSPVDSQKQNDWAYSFKQNSEQNSEQIIDIDKLEIHLEALRETNNEKQVRL